MSSTTLPTFKLPHDPLTPMDPNEAPTPAAIHNLMAEVYSNAMAIQTELGGGQHGHLGLVMPAAQYILLPGAAPYDLPAQRPDIPDYSNAADAAERDQWKDLYHDESRQYTEAHAIALQLKTLLIQAVPLIYISHLQHHLLKFATVSTLEILHLLEENYGTITSDDLCANQDKLQAPWDPNTPIEAVFTNGTACRQFAEAGGEPITDSMYMRYLLQVFQNSGVLAKAVTDWKDKPDADKTIPNFMSHFTRTNKTRCQDEKSLKGTLTANTAVQNTSTKPGPTEAMRYCWSHGLCNHTSAQCTQPAEGHVKTATLANLKAHGGCTQIHRPPGFKPVFKPKYTNNRRNRNSNRENQAPTQANQGATAAV
jgi:hypothetical protein